MKKLYSDKKLEGIHFGSINCLKNVKEAKKLYSAGNDGILKSWNYDACLETEVKRHKQEINGIKEFSGKILTSSIDGNISIWEVNTGSYFGSYNTNSQRISSFIIDQNKLFTATNDKLIRMFDLDTKCVQRRFSGHTGNLTKLLTVGNDLFSCGIDNTLRRWDIETGKEVIKYSENPSWFLTMLKLDEKTIVTGDKTGKMSLWNIDQKEPIFSKKIHKGMILNIFFENGMLFLVDKNGNLIELDASMKKSRKKVELHKGVVTCINMKKGTLFSAGSDKKAYFWKAKKSGLKKISTVIFPENDDIHSFSFFSNKKKFALGTKNGDMHFYNYKTEKSLLDFKIAFQKNSKGRPTDRYISKQFEIASTKTKKFKSEFQNEKKEFMNLCEQQKCFNDVFELFLALSQLENFFECFKEYLENIDSNLKEADETKKEIVSLFKMSQFSKDINPLQYFETLMDPDDHSERNEEVNDQQENACVENKDPLFTLSVKDSSLVNFKGFNSVYSKMIELVLEEVNSFLNIDEKRGTMDLEKLEKNIKPFYEEYEQARSENNEEELKEILEEMKSKSSRLKKRLLRRIIFNFLVLNETLKNMVSRLSSYEDVICRFFSNEQINARLLKRKSYFQEVCSLVLNQLNAVQKPYDILKLSSDYESELKELLPWLIKKKKRKELIQDSNADKVQPQKRFHTFVCFSRFKPPKKPTGNLPTGNWLKLNCGDVFVATSFRENGMAFGFSTNAISERGYYPMNHLSPLGMYVLKESYPKIYECAVNNKFE